MTSILQELHEAHKAAKERLYGAGYAKLERDREVKERARLDAIKATREERRRLFLERYEMALEYIPRNIPTLLQIAHLVCLRRGVTITDFLSERRYQPASDARKEYYYIARMRTKASWPKIARFCGNRDHTTAMSGARRWAEQNGLPKP